MSRFLVTGGAGFLGSHLCSEILNQGNRVLCLDDLSTGSLDNILDLQANPDFEFIEHDLTKPFFPSSIDGIFNLASPASPVHFQFNPIRTLKMGTLAMYNILGMASRLKIPILQASTSEVYGDPLEEPQSESYWGNVNPIGPRACYDEGKRVAEALCMAYHTHSNVDIRIARIFNTYGPHMSPTDGRVVSNFIVQSILNDSITVYGSGNQTRSFCYVSDLIDALIRLMNSNYNMPVNIGSNDEIKIGDLAKIISELTNTKSSIVFEELPVDDPKKRRPELTLAAEILDWQPSTSLEKGLKKTIGWFRKTLR